MKKSIFIIALFLSNFAFGQSMNFVTLGVHFNGNNSYENGLYHSSWTAYYAVQGCPYSKCVSDVNGSVCSGIVAFATLVVLSPTTDAAKFTTIALDSANSYRERTYPDIIK